MDLAKLQYLAGEWRKKTYPGSTLQDILQKLSEETGEANGAEFKHKWARSEEFKSKHKRNMYEEFGDVGLTLLSACEFMNWDLETLLIKRAAEKGMLDG